MNVKTHVFWSDEDDQYVAVHDDYPSLSWLDDSLTGAILGLNALLESLDDDEDAGA